MTGCPADTRAYGQPIAVAFAGDGSVVVQSREPAMLAFDNGVNVSLSTETRNDTGHLLFHANAGGFVACATCHVEGDDDGRVWAFGDCTTTSPRRTQSLLTGLRGTEPFHWNGDESTFELLLADVLVTRMSGPKLSADQMNGMLSWIDAQPRARRRPLADAAAVQRGAALFNDTQNVGCVACHAGARFSNNASMDVGTGRAFQVPSLVGIGTRGPFMHDGCAATLRDRFNPACGGANHGITAQLSSGQIDDLVAYLQSL
jgi:cytochrome c peroxidase